MRARSFFAATTLLLVLTAPGSAQTFTSITDGSTPSALTPGAPAGSYALSGFENVNLYNGNLNLALPLLHVGGRGSADFTMMLSIEQHWRIRKPKPAPNCELTGTCDLRFPWPSGWASMLADYGPGVLQGRKPGVECGDLSLTRLTFSAPGNTEFELRDQLSNGQPLAFTCGASQGASRGTVFVTADGSAATFVSDTTIFDTTSQNSTTFMPSGYLMFRDGTRYRIEAGKVTWIRDRNGNKLTFTYSGSKVITITDALNRQVNIAYSVADVSPYGTCDQITYKGFGGAQRTVRVSKTSLANALRTTRPSDSTTTWTPKQLFPDLDGSATTQHNPTVVSALWVPDEQRRYRFYYNVYGELARVELPTGGAIEYDFANATNPHDGIYRRITERRVYPDGVSLESKTTYSDGITSPVTVDVRDAAGTLLARSKHYFNGSPISSLDQLPTEYAGWKDGREYKTEAFAGNGTTLLRQVTSTWQQRAAVSWWNGNPDLAPPSDPRITEILTTLADANQVSKRTFGYDDSVPFNNPNNVKEYDFGSGVPGVLLRETRTTYLTSSGYTGTSVHIRSLPTQVSTFDGGGIERARTTYEYDNYVLDGADCLHSFHCSLKSRSNISGFDALFGASYTTRGNGTGSTRYLLTNGVVTGSVSAYSHYDVAGNVVRTVDPRSTLSNYIVTKFEYDDRFGSPDIEARSNTVPSELTGLVAFAVPTKITNPLGHTAYTQFDYYLGRPVNSEDANGIVAAAYFDDALDRPTQIRRAAGTAVTNQSSFNYDDVNRVVTTTRDLNSNNDNLLVSKLLYDGLGRTSETRQYEAGGNYIVTELQYDALGHPYKTSNPYRRWLSETAIWTTTLFDSLGRVISVTTPDGAVVNTSYLGNTVSVTDQTGKARKSVTDALGRLVTIYEDPSGVNYQTSYAYDVLDDLTSVTQGVQTRVFVYDSLKRLASATNPESGTTTYTYDHNGNMLTRVDSRSVTTTMAYDALNRLTSRSYNDIPQTPVVNYFYDAQSLPGGAPSFDRGYSTGRLVATTYGGGSEGTYRGYDQAGRVVRQYQRTDSLSYLVEASYYANGSVHDVTYPSIPGAADRRVVSYTNDDAGRLTSLNSSATSYAPAASVSSIGYASHNGLKSETYGNGLIHAMSYNNRLQTDQIKLGTAGSPTSVVGLTYNYGTTTNNGNILSVSYSGGGLSYTQSFGYDGLNRLTTSQETNGGTSWSQTNGYDRYGNRWVSLGGGSQSLYFNVSSNRITGLSYDSAGNLLNDGAHAYTFNGDNMIRAIDGQSAYVYNGDGQRVRKFLGENLRFVYGIGGELIAEFDGTTGTLKKEYIYGASGLVATIEPTALNANGTRYSTADHLGSPRIITNSSAGVVSRHDYMPFGEELGAGVGGRTVGLGFSVGDGVRQKFTSYERDSESSLDYAGARFYSSSQGRFTSVDPMMASASIGNPQTLNRYSYVINSPLTLVDPSGMFGISPGVGSSGMPLVTLFLNEQTTQQPQPGQPATPVTTQSASLPQSETPMCSPDDVPTTVTVTQLNNPDSVQRYAIGGESLRIGVDLTFTFTNADGEPVAGTVSETVESLEGPPVFQDRRDMPLVNGTVSDTVATPGQAIPNTRAEERAVVENFNKPFVTRQLITITFTTNSGVRIRVTQIRTLTNQTAGAGRIAGGLIGGYTFTMEPPQISLLP